MFHLRSIKLKLMKMYKGRFRIISWTNFFLYPPYKIVFFSRERIRNTDNEGMGNTLALKHVQFIIMHSWDWCIRSFDS